MVFEARSMRTELIKASFTTLDIIQELVEEWLCNIIGSGMTCVVRKVQGILDNTLNLLEFVNHGLQLTHDPSMHANAAFFFLEIFRATTYKSNSYINLKAHQSMHYDSATRVDSKWKLKVHRSRYYIVEIR